MQIESPKTQNGVIEDICVRFPGIGIIPQRVQDDVPTLWVDSEHVRDVLAYLKAEIDCPYRMLYDLCAVDERARRVSPDQPAADFSVVYHLLSFERNSDVRVKVPLKGEYPSVPTVTDLWKNANWYEREVWDMFGIEVEGHPFLQRILNPPWWVGHPLRKDQPARATEMAHFTLTQEEGEHEEDELRIHPEKFGFTTRSENNTEYMYMNLGPHHPGNHGLVRYALQLDGERINDAVVDIGWHHRGAEKMAERQTFHTYIPYTDRIDYLGGFQNELPYVLTVEKMAGITVPEKSQVIRVMLAELFRIASHVVWFGTLAQDLGAMSPVFFTFTDRERVFEIIEAVAGGRMHPEWFRIGGVAGDLPNGWKKLVDGFVKYFDPRITEYEKMVVKNSVFRNRTKGVGVYTTESAIEWGVTGPNLRSTGLEWDLRKKRPYSGYDQFDFEIPTATDGDSLARTVVRLAEMRQSLRIVKQAADNMPEGDYKSRDPMAMPPMKEETMVAIETLINHFLSVSWGKPIPANEAMVSTEAPKGINGYYLISDGSAWPYRCHIRTPSFPHLQTVPMLCRDHPISDLIAILGSIDYVLADVDR